MRFATSSSNSGTSVWSPDGNRIAFISKHDGRDEIHIAGMDGRYIIFTSANAETNMDIWILPMSGDRKPVPCLRGTAAERGGKTSPDGRWPAYFSNQTSQEADGGEQLVCGNRGARIAVPVKAGEEFEPGPARKLFTFPLDITSGATFGDGSHTLVSIATNKRPRDIRLILDGTALLGQ
jgi:hypothetical protein